MKRIEFERHMAEAGYQYGQDAMDNAWTGARLYAQVTEAQKQKTPWWGVAIAIVICALVGAILGLAALNLIANLVESL